MSAGSVILFFVRDPEPGEVKTRLAAVIGSRAAADLYASFLLDLAGVLRSGPLPFRFVFSPPDREAALRQRLGAGVYRAQEGGDLGERMKNAFITAFDSGFSRAVLIGSDSPDLPPSRPAEAIELLGRNDAVLGPAHDGGYYLVGFTRRGFVPEAFSGPCWGADTVFRDTLAILARKKARVGLLPPFWDVDTFDDVKALARRGSAGPHTAAALARLGCRGSAEDGA